MNALKAVVKKSLITMGVSPATLAQASAFVHQLGKTTIIPNVNGTHYGKYALLSYIVEPFKEAPSKQNVHQNHPQTLVIAEILGEMGYDVDVVDFSATRVRLPHRYSLVIDIEPKESSPYWHRLLPDCKKIVYLTGSEMDFAIKAEQARLDALAARRGKHLVLRRAGRLLTESLVRRFDYTFMIGNAYNYATYTRALPMPPVTFIPNTGYAFPHIDSRRRSARNFLFFASSGQVHKGLDLLLEVFAQQDFPFHLYICSAFKNEQDFCELYDQELYHTPNIHAIGFVDIRGDAFKQVVEACAFSITPSCSEGQAGSVVTTMSAGIIPICSRECGFDDDEVFNLADVSLDTLEKAVRTFAAKEPQWIQEKSLYAQKIVQERFQMANFRAAWTKGLQAVLD